MVSFLILVINSVDVMKFNIALATLTRRQMVLILNCFNRLDKVHIVVCFEHVTLIPGKLLP